MSEQETIGQIRTAVESFQKQLPATANMKLVFAFELDEGGDIQLFRIELPGPEVVRHPAGDARVTVMMDRGMFDHMLEDGSLARYRRAYGTGRIKTAGSQKIQKLLLMVIEKQEEANEAAT